MEKADCKSETYTYGSLLFPPIVKSFFMRFVCEQQMIQGLRERDNFVTFLTYNFTETSQVYLLR